MREFYLRIKEYDGINDLYLKQANTSLGAVSDLEIGNVLQQLPTSVSQELDIKKNTSTISSMSLVFTNINLKISELVYENFYNVNSFYEKKCEVGYYDTDTITKTVIYTGELSMISPDTYETQFTFNLKDSLEQLKETTLKYTSTGAEAFNISTLLSEEMPNTTDFTRFGRIENAGFTGSYLYNYQDTTDQSTFNSWTDTKWIVLSWSGHPIDLCKYLLSELEIEYDNSSFEEVRTDVKNDTITSFYYEWKEPIKNTLEWLTEQVFKPLNCYPIIKSDGKIYLSILKQPTLINLPEVIDDLSIVKINSNKPTTKNITNHLFIHGDFNIEKDQYFTQVYDIENVDSEGRDSIGAFGFSPKNAEIFKIQGVNPNAIINGTSNLNDRIDFFRELAGYVFSRFALTTRVINLDVLEEKANKLNVGDVVVLSGTQLVQWRGVNKGVRGLPVISTSEYGVIGSAFWGEYLDTYESNNFLSDGSGGGIQVSELIIIDFFEGLLENYNLSESFLTQHNR